ncbi:Alpha/Beta hydrolase protein [Naematelia encephala]|uniref:Alpha/Beta hydrolase protein n=1 Tax=Naematelia encephala TaxID=71784 RepID=A0A1Y2BMW2_9TREE|nr:Alpha/Beta hydrolase protein [Naematelia encephala]
MTEEPTALSDPQAYLSLLKFNRRLGRCPRTGLPVSYADIGDPSGVPLLWLLPSGCSRWFAAPQDPLCKHYGIRLIAIDRPGVGATPNVPLEDRIATSCNMTVSVLEHLGIKPNHILATSAGIYYALHLLVNHHETFFSQTSPPPYLYLISPWSPLLPQGHPDYYPSLFTWIPDTLISTQHLTLPHLASVAKSATNVWALGTKALASSLQLAKSLLPADPQIHVNPQGVPVPEVSAVDDEPERQTGFWGKCPCCIGCLTTDYFQEENMGGVGQEHLICLNRGSMDTGPEWLEGSISALSGLLASSHTSPLSCEIWWGWQDGMVPRKGQIWFNKVISAHPDYIKVKIRDVPDGDHTDLLGRYDGIHEVYYKIQKRGRRQDIRQEDTQAGS